MTRNTFSISAIAAVIALAILDIPLPAWSADSAAAARLPVPVDGDVTQWRKKIRDAYEAEYRATKESGEPETLLDKLRKDTDSASEPAKKYAFLLEAEDVATQSDDSAATLALVDRRAELFEIDCLAERSKTLARLAGPKIAADLTLMDQATATATKAATAERFDIATASATLALKIAQAIDREQKAAARRRPPRKPAGNEVVPAPNGVTLIKSAADLQKRIGKQRELFTAYEEAKAVLARQPDDPAANAAAGTYLCFIACKWDQGLPHLKASQVPVFGDMARDELALEGDDRTPKAVFTLAGRWWDAAEGKSLANDEQTAVRDHAARLYAEILPALTDPLERRIADTRGAKDAVVARPLLVNSIGMKLTLIPAGTFMMGSNEGEADERPVHEVEITNPFYLSVTEVTNAQWKRVMGGEPPSLWKGDDHPVETVSWNNAVAFCDKLSQVAEERESGRVYRLPSEAEWEYACRAGTTTRWFCGNDTKLLHDFAWFAGNVSNGTHPVGNKRANPWGLHDMHGNVWEWCNDWSGQYAARAVSDPTGPAGSANRAIRGGGFDDLPNNCRSADRRAHSPSHQNQFAGFRVALSRPERSSLVSDRASKPVSATYTPASDFVCANGDLGVVIKKYVGKDKNIRIPPRVNGLPVTEIDRDAFKGRSDLTEITLPMGVLTIGPMAFHGCTQLTVFSIPETVKSIGFNAMEMCNRLRRISIPASVVDLGAVPFNNSLSLSEITVAAENPKYSSIDGILYDKAVKTLISCPAGKEGDLVLPESVQRVSGWSFQNCKNLRSVTVPEHAVVEPEAFNGCPAEIRR